MINEDYKVVEVFWKGGDINVQIIKLNSERISEKLRELSCDDGISESEFESFIAHKCILDLDTVGSIIVEEADDFEKELALHKEIIDIIISINPEFSPDLLFWKSKSGIFKPDEVENFDDCIKLNGNPLWNTDPFDDMLNEVMGNPSDFFSMMDEEGAYFNEEHEKYVKEIIKKEWEDTSLIINIKKYDKKVLDELFSTNKNFIGPRSYEMFVIHKCVVNHTKLLILIDSMGVVRDLPPDDVTKIIYDFCVEINPFLNLNNVKGKYITIGRKTSVKTPETRRTATPTKKITAALPSSGVGTKTKVGFSSIKKDDLLSLSDKIKKRVVGQDEAIDNVVEIIQIAGAGLRDPAKPLGTFIFTGMTGSGKTFLAKNFAKTLCGSEASLIRIDCSEYSHGHEVSKLIGSPNGYINSDAGGILTNKVMETPFAVVLFDEIEKAHSKIYDILLQVLDEGRLSDNKGTVVDFSDCLVILTSNIGVKDVSAVGKRVGFGDVSNITQKRKEFAIEKALKKRFKPEFLNRLDSVITFNTLTKDDAAKIVDLEFNEVTSYIKNKNITLKMSNSLKKYILDKGFSVEYGARALKRVLERDVIKPTAIKILHEEIKDNNSVLLDYKDDKLVFSIEKKKAKVVKPRKRPTPVAMSTEADIEIID